MPDKLASDFVHTNAEYEKLKGSSPDGKTPRELPSAQGPGRTGYAREKFDEWTHEELLARANSLEIDVSDKPSREHIIDRLDEHDATLARRGGK